MGEQIKEILEFATKVFDDADAAEKWLKEPNLATNNEAPITLLGSQEGYQRVKTLLGRIEHGLLG